MPAPHDRPPVTRVLAGASAAIRQMARALTLGALWSVLPAPAFALDPTQRLNQLHHTAWTAKDGLIGTVQCVTETTDGYLWVGTSDGLFRFDGLQFERWQPETGEIPAAYVSALLGVPDGLWIGYQHGHVSFLDEDGRLSTYTEREGLPIGRVRSFARDHDGVVWVATVSGLARLDGQRWRRIRDQLNFTSRSAWRLLVDRHGSLWVAAASPDRIYVRPKGESNFRDTGVALSGYGLALTKDGTLLFSSVAESGIHATTIGADRRARPREILDLPCLQILVDRDGGIWIAGYDIVRGRVSGTSFPVERLSQREGLSGGVSAAVFEDREGNVWVATESGLDRFRNRNLTWERYRDATVVTGLVSGGNGDVWALSDDRPSLRRVQDGTIVRHAPDSLAVGVRDRHGALWLAGLDSLTRWQDGRFQRIERPAAVRARRETLSILSLTMDRDDRLWASINGYGQYLFKDNTWTFKPILPGRPTLTAIAAHTDDQDRVWLVYRDDLARVEGDTVRVFTARDGLTIAPLLVVAGRDRQLWVGGELGLALMQGDRFHAVRSASGTRYGAITGIAATRDNGLWLCAGIGIVHVPQAEIEQVKRDPSYRVRDEFFDLVSDLPEPTQPRRAGPAVASVIEGEDGVLWFVTVHGIARVDPRRVSRNTQPPSVKIRALVADEQTYSGRGETKLPARPRTIRIDYTALSLSIPERVRFRYRLEGWETDWHDAGSRRSAFYTQLGPGAYRFRVIACNNDGVWNETGATLAFHVAPAWFQTHWFYALVVMSVITLLWLIYRLRVRQVAAALGVRFDERLAERTRIARDLHDTLMQTVQASRMLAEDAREHANDPEDKRALDQLAAWLNLAVREGRAALNSLRVPATHVSNLAQALRVAAETCPARPPGMTVSVSVLGQPHPVHHAVQDEVYRIAYEAIRNACAHSCGTHLATVIEYTHDLIVRVTDNGLGICATVSTHGKEGRFGLPGMRERAAGIGARLEVLHENPGTSIVVTVPGRLAFRRGAAAETDRSPARHSAHS